MKVLVTGATGHFGGFVVKSLLNKMDAKQIAVSVRNPEKASTLAVIGIDVRHGDFDLPETLATAFEGIDKLLIVSTDLDNETRIRQHLAAVEASKKAGVKHIIYTSVADAPHSPLSLAEVHRRTEKAIVESGIAYTFLRNNWYLENEISSIQAAIAGAPWVTSAQEGKVGWTLKREYAEAAANVLATEGHENKIYELSSQPQTQETLAAIVSKEIGKEIPVLQVSDDGYAEGLRTAQLPEFLVEMFTDIQKSIREGALDVKSSDFEKLLGRAPLSLETAVAELVKGL